MQLLGRRCAWLFSQVWLFVTPWTVARQAPLSMGILLARILEWVAIPISRGSSQPRDETQVYLLCRQILYHLSYQGSPRKKRGGLIDYCRFSSLSGMGSELSFKVVICVKWLVSLKTLKSITFLKIHPGSMLISFKISQIMTPLNFPQNGEKLEALI